MSARPLTSRRTLALNTFSSLTTRVLQLTVLVWVNQYLLRHVETAEYALMPLVLSLLVFGELFRAIFTGALGRFIIDADARGDDAGVTRIVSSMMPALAAAFITLGGATVVAIWHIDQLLSIEPEHVMLARTMLALLMGSLCLDLLVAPFSQGLYVRQKFVALNSIELGGEALRAALICGLMLGVKPSVLWLPVGSFVVSVLSLTLRVILTRRLVPAIRWRRGEFHVATARRLLGFGAWTSVHGLTNLIATTAPALLLNRFATPLHVASFHLGRLPDLQLRRLAAAAAVPMQPMLTSLQALRGPGALHDLYYRGGRYHLWIILLTAAPLVMFAAPLMRLYAGQEYALAAGVLAPLLAIYPLTWASAMFYRIAHAVGRVGAFYACDLVVQLVTLVVLYWAVAIRSWGAPGAAMAIAGTSGLLHIVLIWPFGLRLVAGCWRRFFRQTLVPGILPFGAALVVAAIFRHLVTVETWWQLGVGSTLTCVAYVAVLLLFCLDAPDRALLGRVGSKLRPSRPPEGTRVGWRGQST